MAMAKGVKAMSWDKLKTKLVTFAAYFTGWKKLALEVLLIVIVFVAVRAYQQSDSLTGDAIPLNGQLVDQSQIDWQSYQGKPLLLHFWATWCPICKIEEGSIQSISEDYNVLTVSSWSDDTEDYLKEKGLNFKTLVDNDGVWASRYGIKGVPASFIIGPDGKIEFIETGYSSEIGLRLRLWWIEL